MATYSVNWSARLASTAGTVSVGMCLVLLTDGTHLVATTANRTTYGRAIGIAATAGDATTLVVEMIETGSVPASITGLAVGTVSWVRVSSTGTLERVTPGSGDDIVGKAHADGSVQFHPGVFDSANYAGGGGGSFTAGGDLTGDATTQTVAKINATTITTAGGALAVGAVLRTTAAGTADWGAVDLADADAVTGVLPKANQGAQDMAGDVTGTTAAAVVAKVNGATVPASGALTTGNAPYVSGISALTYSALNLAGGSGWISGVLPLANGGTNASAGLTTANGVVTSSGTALQQATNVLAGSGYVSIGATPATAGALRLPNGGGTSDGWIWSKTTGGTDRKLFGLSDSDNVEVGDGNHPAYVRGSAAGGTHLGLGAYLSVYSDHCVFLNAAMPWFTTSGGFTYKLAVSNLAADRTITLPLLLASDTFVFEAHTQTLTNKTIAGASNTLSVRIANDVTGLGTGVATFLGTPSSANLLAALTDETGTGAAVFGTSPTLTTPVINGQIQGAAVAISAMAIDWTLGTVFTKTLAAGANTFTFSNQASGMVITVRVTGATSTLTWPTVKWAGGAAPTQTSAGIDVYTFVHDGTSVYGSVVQAMA